MIKTESFKAWFSESKAVDNDGKPEVAYHGTKADFSEFLKTRSGEFGPAIYLTSNPREAGEYASGKGWGGVEGTRVMPVFVSIKNPFEGGVDAFWARFAGDDGDAQAVLRARAAGYDGVITTRADRYYDNDAQEFIDRGEMLTHYVAFEPWQVKSAIGNNGNFDAHNPDIRYSTQDGAAWIGSTAVTSQDGAPLIVYRGQHGATANGDLQCMLASITFCADPAVASHYAEHPNDLKMEAQTPFVIPAYLEIANPIFVHDGDPFVDASVLIDKLGPALTEAFFRKHAAHVENAGHWDEFIAPLFKNVDAFLNNSPERVKELYVEAWVLLDDFEFVAAAKAAGYDGAISTGTGESMSTLEYRVFDTGQIKPACIWASRVQERRQMMAELLVEQTNSTSEAPHG